MNRDDRNALFSFPLRDSDRLRVSVLMLLHSCPRTLFCLGDLDPASMTLLPWGRCHCRVLPFIFIARVDVYYAGGFIGRPRTTCLYLPVTTSDHYGCAVNYPWCLGSVDSRPGPGHDSLFVCLITESLAADRLSGFRAWFAP